MKQESIEARMKQTGQEEEELLALPTWKKGECLKATPSNLESSFGRCQRHQQGRVW